MLTKIKIDKNSFCIIIQMMRGQKVENIEWTLYAIAKADKKGLSPIRLQKSLFMLGANLPDFVGKKFYTFRPYNYGPFCIDVYNDVDRLIEKEYVKANPVLSSRWYEYTITPAGNKYLKEIELNDTQKVALDYLGSVVEWTQELNFQQLVSTIYSLYPEYKKNSIF